MITLTDTCTPMTPLTCKHGDYTRFKAWFALVPGFTAYDAAKWAQRAMRGLNGDRTALTQLESAGFTITVG